MTSRQFSARFDLATVERLERRAKRTGVSKSQLAQRYIEEGLRMADHPGIVFRDGVSGRRAALATGPDVWQVIWVLRSGEDRGESAIAGTADWMALSVDQVRSAIRYYADFSDEVDERIRRNVEMADEAGGGRTVATAGRRCGRAGRASIAGHPGHGPVRPRAA